MLNWVEYEKKFYLKFKMYKTWYIPGIPYRLCLVPAQAWYRTLQVACQNLWLLLFESSYPYSAGFSQRQQLGISTYIVLQMAP